MATHARLGEKSQFEGLEDLIKIIVKLAIKEMDIQTTQSASTM